MGISNELIKEIKRRHSKRESNADIARALRIPEMIVRSVILNIKKP